MKMSVALSPIVGVIILGLNGKGLSQDDVGALEFHYGCAACHGPDAKGNGPLAVAEQLKNAPPDLTTLAKKNKGIFPLNAIYDIIDGRREIGAHGTRDMPVWGHRYMPSASVVCKSGIS